MLNPDTVRSRLIPRGLAAVVAFATLAILLLASAPGAEARGVKRCRPPHDYPGYVLGLRIRNGACRTARNVARVWYEGACGPDDTSVFPTCRAHGFFCRNRSLEPNEDLFGYSVKCKRGRKTVRFRTPPNGRPRSHIPLIASRAVAGEG